MCFWQLCGAAFIGKFLGLKQTVCDVLCKIVGVDIFEGEEYRVLQDYVIIVFSTAHEQFWSGLLHVYTRNDCLATRSATICFHTALHLFPHISISST